jgi:hypothetical protein
MYESSNDDCVWNSVRGIGLVQVLDLLDKLHPPKRKEIQLTVLEGIGAC